MTMRTLTLAGAALTLAATALVAGGALSPASAASRLTSAGAFTDNYKASYNADPTATELRTWLAMRRVAAAGVTYTPVSVPATGFRFVAASTGLAVKGSDGSRAVLSARTGSSNALGQGFFRIDASGLFGLLIQERSREALRAGPVREVLSLVRGTTLLAQLRADYTYDAAVFDAAPGSIEYNGPGGRWWVDGVATRLNWQTTAPTGAALDTVPPLLSAVSFPASTTTRAISVAISATDNRAVTGVRFANEDGLWSAWQPFAPTKAWTLSASPIGYKGVTTQVRDAAGNESGTVYRRITCTCP